MLSTGSTLLKLRDTFMRIRKRTLFWGVNAVVFNLCRLVPFRDARLWVFGACVGKRYDDNSRALFEHVNRHHRGEVRAVWIACDARTVREIRGAGGEAYPVGSLHGKWLSLRCGAAFMTHGIDDFGTVPLVGGAEVVALWHGVGFKKIYGATYHGVRAVAMKIANTVFSWTYRTVTCVTSEYTRWQFHESFGTDGNNTFITGQPRNDALRSGKPVGDVLRRLGVPVGKRVILYMPTYRWGKDGDKRMEEIVREIMSCRELHAFLQREGYVFLIKLHPVTNIDCPRTDEEIRILDNVCSVQDLLRAGSCLITDYSSCFTDYALLDRPIIFYTPDFAEYMEKDKGMYEEYFSVCSTNRADTPRQLVEMLSRLADGNLMKQTEVINDYFEDESIRGTCYSENVYRMVRKRLL